MTHSTAIVQLARLGDLAQSWPLVARLSQVSQVSLVVNSGLAPIAALMTDNVISIDLKGLLGRSAKEPILFEDIFPLVRCLAGSPHDRVINLNFHSASAAIAEAIPTKFHSGPRWADVVKGVASDSQVEELFEASQGDRNRGRHLSDIWAGYASGSAVVQESLHTPYEYRQKGIELLASEGMSLDIAPVAFVVGAGLAGRVLPYSTWEPAIRAVLNHAPVVLIGAKGEEAVAESLMSSIAAPRSELVNLVGKSDLLTLVGLLAQCRLVVGVDTGALHLAAAVGVKCAGIFFGSMSYRQTGPYGDGHTVFAPTRPGSLLAESALRNLSATEMPPARGIVDVIMSMLDSRAPCPPAGWGVFRSCMTTGGISWDLVG